MSRADFELPNMRAAADLVQGTMLELKRRGLIYSNWVGTLTPEHYPTTELNKGPGYEALPWFHDDPNIPWFTLWEYSWVLVNSGVLAAQNPLRILSLGGSSSAFDAFLASLGHNIVVIEARPYTVENTRKNIAEMGWDMEIVLGNIGNVRNLLSGRAPFDLCVSTNVLFLSGEEAQKEVRDGLADIVRMGGVHCFTFDVFNPNPKRYLADPVAHFDVRGFRVDPEGEEFYDNGERHHLYYPEPELGRYTAGGLRQVRVA